MHDKSQAIHVTSKYVYLELLQLQNIWYMW